MRSGTHIHGYENGQEDNKVKYTYGHGHITNTVESVYATDFLYHSYTRSTRNQMP